MSTHPASLIPFDIVPASFGSTFATHTNHEDRSLATHFTHSAATTPSLTKASFSSIGEVTLSASPKRFSENFLTACHTAIFHHFIEFLSSFHVQPYIVANALCTGVILSDLFPPISIS